MLLLTRHFSGDLMKKNVMGGSGVMYGEKRGAYRILVRKNVRKVGRSRRG